jgi:hypothetical protein
MYDNNEVHIYPSVYLWNDIDKIKGELHLTAENLVFIAEGFEHSHLQLSIPLPNIDQITDYKLYDISVLGLQINTFDDKTTVFILDNSVCLKKQLKELIKALGVRRF